MDDEDEENADTQQSASQRRQGDQLAAAKATAASAAAPAGPIPLLVGKARTRGALSSELSSSTSTGAEAASSAAEAKASSSERDQPASTRMQLDSDAEETDVTQPRKPFREVGAAASTAQRLESPAAARNTPNKAVLLLRQLEQELGPADVAAMRESMFGEDAEVGDYNQPPSKSLSTSMAADRGSPFQRPSPAVGRTQSAIQAFPLARARQAATLNDVRRAPALPFYWNTD